MVAVSQSFPVNWIWWVTLIVCTFILSSLSEISIYYLHDMVEIAVVRSLALYAIDVIIGFYVVRIRFDC